jgi:uncharacterized protein (DUF1499 family)
MRTTLWIVALLLAAIVIYFFVLGVRSKTGAAPGMVNGELTQCGTKPNCVCSEQREQNDFYIEPLALKDGANEPLAMMKTVLLDMGAELITETDTYLATTFTSGIFGFVDDLEVRWDQDNSVLQLRSASRVGHSDLGANRKRVERVRDLFQQQQNNG